MIKTIEAVKSFIHAVVQDPPALYIIICGLLLVISIILGIIFPIIFNYKIIPKIEKQIGQKLEYHSTMKNYMVFWKFFWPYLEVSHYIFFKYLTKKTKINFGWCIPQDYALRKVNYDINQSSRFEIIISILALFNVYLTFASSVIGVFIANHYNVH